MKKAVSIVLLFIFSNSLLAQSKQPNIQFDTDYFKAVDHWVVVPEVGTENKFLLGYIYIDEVTGFTFTESFPIEITPRGKWMRKASESIILKRHLDKSTPLVLLVSTGKIRELKLPKKSRWPNHEKDDHWIKGFHFNAIGKSEFAIPYLKIAYRKNPRNAAFELAYAYNATDQFEKAVTLLSDVLKYKKDVVLFRELGYALMKKGAFDDAEKAYENGIQLSNDNSQKAEMAVDMAKQFFQLRDTIKFEKWLSRSKKFAKKEEFILKIGDASEIKNSK